MSIRIKSLSLDLILLEEKSRRRKIDWSSVLQNEEELLFILPSITCGVEQHPIESLKKKKQVIHIR